MHLKQTYVDGRPRYFIKGQAKTTGFYPTNESADYWSAMHIGIKEYSGWLDRNQSSLPIL